MGRGGRVGRRRVGRRRRLVLTFEVPQAAGNGQAHNRRRGWHAQGPDFGVRGPRLDEGIGAFQQILGQSQLCRGLSRLHTILLSSTAVAFNELHKYYSTIYYKNANKQYKESTI